jgi:membrane dipeptidase
MVARMIHKKNIKGPRHLSRRAALGRLMAVAGAAVLGTRTPRSQSATAPIGDSSQLADLGMDLSAEQRAAGITFLQRYPSVDTHCHPGRFFLESLPYETPTTRAFGAPFEKTAIADLNQGNVSAALFAAVADMRLLEMTSTGGLHSGRDFQPGEAYADYKRQIGLLKALLGSHDLTKGLTPSDVDSAHRRQKTAAVFAVEGGDFIEDRLDRVHEAFHDGVRAITIVHYHINQIGDIQTEAPVHQGLTPLGKSIVREMNQAGIIVDLAHAPLAVCKDVIDVSTKPVMVSHSNLLTPKVSHPRLISSEHARLVAGAGGIIGSWPSGVGQATFADYIDSIQRLVDVVGIEHVAIGTDMDANYKPVLRSYRDWSLIPAALLARGLHDSEVAQIMGGNFQRIFKSSV